MNPFDPASIASFWADGTRALLDQQQRMAKALTESWQWLATGGEAKAPALFTELGGIGNDLAQASQSMIELGNAAASLFGALTQRISGEGAGTEAETPAAAALAQMMDPRSWTGGEMDDMLGRVAEGPRMADLWDMERRQARIMRAWVEVQRRTLEHNAVMLRAWMDAGKAFGDEFAGRSSMGAEPPDIKRALAVWTDVANRQLLETQRSEPFLTTQAAVIRANTEFRLAQQDFADRLSERYGLPSRRELDDVHKTVTELRREVRALKRAATAPAQPPAARPPRTGSKRG